MYTWRISKYDPSARDAQGRYLVDDWTAVTDIGATFGGRLLTADEYTRVEAAYIETALALWAEGKPGALKVASLEWYGPNQSPLAAPFNDIVASGQSLREGTVIDSEELLALVCRLNLREIAWCRIVGKKKFCIRFGYDYYMYVRSAHPCADAVARSRSLGLFAEAGMFPSED